MMLSCDTPTIVINILTYPPSSIITLPSPSHFINNETYRLIYADLSLFLSELFSDLHQQYSQPVLS